MLIYKYRSLSEFDFPNTRSIVAERTIYFATYTQLNDPFEYSYRWTTDAPNIKKVEFWSGQDDHYCQALDGQPEAQKIRDITQWENTMSPPRGAKIIGADRVGVFCASTVYDNMVLWSMYADHHRGVCFCFETDQDEVLSRIHRVKYSCEPGAFSLYDGIVHTDVMTRKFKDWRFEKEFRAFRELAGSYQYDLNALRSVIFGANAYVDRAHRTRLDEIERLTRLNFPNATVHRVLRDQSAYKLDMIGI
jgi:hypothetical protein